MKVGCAVDDAVEVRQGTLMRLAARLIVHIDRVSGQQARGKCGDGLDRDLLSGLFPNPSQLGRLIPEGGNKIDFVARSTLHQTSRQNFDDNSPGAING